MKTITKMLNHLRLALGAGLFLGSLLPAAAQFASPVGTWDCVVSGSENGIAYLTFNADYTFNGYEVLTPKSAVSSTNENVRGGDDMGRAWYLAGKTAQRTNTCNDFIDVAKGLIAKKYTSAGKISIEGRSAGGQVMGVVYNQAPELWGAVLAGVEAAADAEHDQDQDDQPGAQRQTAPQHDLLAFGTALWASATARRLWA